MSDPSPAIETACEGIWQHAKSLRFRRGEISLQAGDRMPGIHRIRSGSVRVARDHLGSRLTIASLHANEMFGEISYLDGSGASASIVADDDVLIDFVSNSDLDRIFASDPMLAAGFFRCLALELAHRLRETSSMIPILLWHRKEEA